MKALRERLIAQGVHTLLVQFTDVHGTARGELVPMAHLDDVLTIGAGGGSLAHIDIAGPSFNNGSPYGYTHKQGTGCTVRTLVAYVEDLLV